MIYSFLRCHFRPSPGEAAEEETEAGAELWRLAEGAGVDIDRPMEEPAAGIAREARDDLDLLSELNAGGLGCLGYQC